MLKKPELLAPAGTLEKMKMALLYGADAVYLGGKLYGLRALGGNFTKEELREAVEFAHALHKKVYVTVNIFPHNSDLVGLPDYLRYLQEIGVDALLVADLGIFMMAKETIWTCISARRRTTRTGRRSTPGTSSARNASCSRARCP